MSVQKHMQVDCSTRAVKHVQQCRQGHGPGINGIGIPIGPIAMVGTCIGPIPIGLAIPMPIGIPIPMLGYMGLGPLY